MTWLRNQWVAIRWRLTVARWHVEARVLALTLGALGIALLVAMIIEPVWTLRYERALAWPVIALAALILFRGQVGALFQGRGVRTVNAGPGGISLELEEQGAGAVTPTLPERPVGDELTERALLLLANLAQIYQIQIDFLRHLHTAADGLLREAAVEWFGSTIGNPDYEVQLLLDWLVGRDLVTLTVDDVYVVAPLGRDFLEAIKDYWYAPKAF